MDPDEIQKVIDKANMQMAAGEYTKSFNTFKKLLKTDPEVGEAYFGMAEAAIGIPKLTIQDIASYYQKACDKSPDNPLFFAAYGNFCFENGILKKGEECFIKAAEIDEENSAMYLSDLANSYYFAAKSYQHKYPDLTDDVIVQTSLKFVLMAYNVDKERAKSLIDKME